MHSKIDAKSSEYVAEVQRKDWKKCCPFNMSGNSLESNYQAEKLFASLCLEDNDGLVNAKKNTKVPQYLKSSEVGNPEGQAAISETHIGVVIGNDVTNTVNDISLESSFGKLTNSHHQIEKFIDEDMVAVENDNREIAVVNDDSLNDINDRATNLSSSKPKNDDVQYQNEDTISEDTKAAGDDKYTSSDEERNLAGEKPKKFRLLSDIYKKLGGLLDPVSARSGDITEFSSESDDDSDEFTLDTYVTKKKAVRVSSKRGVASKKKKKIFKVRDRSFYRAKRMKTVSEDSSLKDTEVGYKRPLRKSRTDKAALQVINKHRKSSAEIIEHGSTWGSQKADSSTLGLGTQKKRGETASGGSVVKEDGTGYGAGGRGVRRKGFVTSRGNKRNRVTIEDDSGGDVAKLLDGIPMHFTKENSLRSSQGVKSAQLVQATINNIKKGSAYARKSINENPPPVDNESMVALELLNLFNSGEKSKTSVVNPTLSMIKDDKMSFVSRSNLGQSHDDFNRINEGVLPLAEQIETGAFQCVMNNNPSEFSIPNAKKYTRHVKVIQK
ncbi:hypothetical protein LXL04_008466 [Taraxacum kok-saghyz]